MVHLELNPDFSAHKQLANRIHYTDYKRPNGTVHQINNSLWVELIWSHPLWVLLYQNSFILHSDQKQYAPPPMVDVN